MNHGNGTGYHIAISDGNYVFIEPEYTLCLHCQVFKGCQPRSVRCAVVGMQSWAASSNRRQERAYKGGSDG
jgi:hypothetical protein